MKLVVYSIYELKNEKYKFWWKEKKSKHGILIKEGKINLLLFETEYDLVVNNSYMVWNHTNLIFTPWLDRENPTHLKNEIRYWIS